jgi:uncharacterized membrane protein YadS
MLIYPWIADALFRGNATAAGMFLGTAIHDTSQVMGAAMIYAQQFAAPDAVAVAGFTKLLRNLSMLVLIPLAAFSMRGSATARRGPLRSRCGRHCPGSSSRSCCSRYCGLRVTRRLPAPVQRTHGQG